MLKKLSILIVFITTAMMGCKTMRMGDVLPETRGTPLGDVVLGKKNADFFVFGENERESVSPESDSGKTLVVFKTRERHPTWRAARVAGTPVRVVKTTIYTAIDKIGGLLTFWIPKKKSSAGAPATEQAARTPKATETRAHSPLPVAMTPPPCAETPAPVAEAREIETREEAALPRSSTETLNWAETIAFPLRGSAPQTDQTGG